MIILSAQNLIYDYGLKRALDDVSFSIQEGRITALVGPNGAGKTTLLRCITGLEPPISGVVTAFGENLFDDPRKSRRQIGYISDSFGLYPRLTVRQCLSFMARSYNIPAESQAARIDEIIELLELQQYAETLTSKLSRGWRQRVGVGMAIIHQPRLLLLDEPASGMDPDSRYKLSLLLLQLRNQGTSIIVSSHILSELEDYCTDMLVMKQGRILEHIHLNSDRSAHMERDVIITLLSAAAREKALPIISSQIGVATVRPDPAELQTIHVTLTGGPDGQARLLGALVRADIPILAYATRQHSLQNAYIDLTRKTGA